MACTSLGFSDETKKFPYAVLQTCSMMHAIYIPSKTQSFSVGLVYILPYKHVQWCMLYISQTKTQSFWWRLIYIWPYKHVQRGMLYPKPKTQSFWWGFIYILPYKHVQCDLLYLSQTKKSTIFLMKTHIHMTIQTCSIMHALSQTKTQSFSRGLVYIWPYKHIQ